MKQVLRRDSEQNSRSSHQKESSFQTEIQLQLMGTFSPKEFHDSVKEFLRLITSISKHISPKIGSTAWEISTLQGEKVILASAISDHERVIEAVDKTISAIGRGLQDLESGSGNEWPDCFLEGAVKNVRNLARLVESDNSVENILIQSGEFSISISARIAQNAQKLIEPQTIHSAYGNVEGKLSTITKRKGFRLAVLRTLDGKSVSCEPAESNIESEAMNALGKRVSVEGMIEYNGKGIPTKVHAERIRVFRPDAELTPLPEIKDLFQ
ncbi:MAG: hypothetical protein OXF84_10670 [Bacteroidetes bacterium]|nr:hypothetical protein [Bacteroidota bacterium]